MLSLGSRLFRKTSNDSIGHGVAVNDARRQTEPRGIDLSGDRPEPLRPKAIETPRSHSSTSGDAPAGTHFTDVEQKFINDLNQKEWKGVMNNVLQPRDTQYCVVVDMSYLNVNIMATHQFLRSGSYLTLVSELELKDYKVKITSAGSVEAIAHIYRLANEQRSSLFSSHENDEEMRYGRIYDDIMTGAYRLKASDVHFEIGEEAKSAVRLRIDGRMREWKTYEGNVLKHAVTAGYGSRSKTGTNSGATFSLERGMSTITRTRVDGVIVEGRFSSLPTTDGTDIVCRVIVTDPSKKTEIRSFKDLGYAPSHCLLLQDALERRSGLFIVAGETGSGKSTMLQSAMYSLPNKGEQKRFAIEDPAEYDHPGVRSISVQRGPDDPEEVVKQKFMATLRQMMRMDPDSLLLGEIRDRQTAEIASEFVQTGHRLLTTAHGDGCIDVLSRLAGRVLGIPEEILSLRKFLSMTGYQTLLPVLCNCKKPAVKHLNKDILDQLENKFRINPENMFCANEQGCSLCIIPELQGPFGTRGRTVAAEIFMPDDDARSLIARRDWNGVEHLWRSSRKTGFADPDMTGKTAFEHGLFKASQGIVDIRDVEGAFESLRTYQIFADHQGNLA